LLSVLYAILATVFADKTEIVVVLAFGDLASIAKAQISKDAMNIQQSAGQYKRI
jgi:hypothetical protein